MKWKLLSSALMLAGLWLFAGCGTMGLQQGGLNTQYNMAELETRISRNPRDYEALRDLGIASYNQDKFRQSRRLLVKAFKLKPSDPQIMLYLGMALEAEKLPKLAHRIYRRYTRVPASSEFRDLMKARYEILNREMIRLDVKNKLAQEAQLGTSTMSPNAIAVFPFAMQMGKDEYAPLGKGLAEMMITDLSQVPNLKLVERIRVQALLDEMALAQTGMIDMNTAPRMGKLVSAGRIVNGSYRVDDRSRVQLDVSFWDLLQQQQPSISSKNDVLNNLFLLEKDLVFNLVENMGIELTPAQRARIQRIPTKNMQAFMAYCMGLEMEDAGQFEAAAQYYEKAVKIDPQFRKAGAKANLCQKMAVMRGPRPKPAQFAGGMRSGRITDYRALKAGMQPVKLNLMQQRFQNLSINIGSTFVPGQDSRKSAEEAETSGVPVYDVLPLPQDPPKLPTRE